MSRYDYDLFVLGAGSGGVRASRMSARHGARVAVAENRYLGGTCVNVGCVPKKLFVYGSHYREDFEDARGYGWTVDGARFDWPTLRDNKTHEIERLNGVYGRLLDNAGVTLMRGTATLVDAHRVRVDGTEVSAERILVATGSWPYVPAFPGSEHVITSNEAFYLERFPERVLVVGGGYIAVEFAGIFAGLGATTTLSYRGPLFLRGFDDDVRAFAADEVRRKRVDVRFSSSVESVTLGADGTRRVRFDDGSTIDVDLVLYATGRRPNVAGLGLEAAGVELTAGGGVRVDADYRSSVANIYAIGDVTDRVQLTPVAIAEAMCVAENLFNGGRRRVDYDRIPTAVFCQPNIGAVGYTESQARERFGDVRIFMTDFEPMKYSLTEREENTLMKLVVDAATDRVVGAHMVGAEAGEIIQGLAVAITANATKSQFDATIGIHPTAAEEFVTMREQTR
jgi:glutathione reductase (NADPH)